MTERADLVTRTSRTRRTATTWLRKAVWAVTVSAEHENEHVRRFGGNEAATLLHDVLSELDVLVRLVPDDDDDIMEWEIEEAVRLSKELARTLRGRRLAAKMDNVKGRTPEEAKAFRAKAEALRA